MPDIAWTDVTALAAELLTGTPPNGVPLEAQGMILAHVNTGVASSEFGGEASPKFRLARIWLAAHYGALTKLGLLGRGPVASQSEGGVSISFTNLQPTRTSLLSATVYGREFLGLVETGPSVAGFVVGAPAFRPRTT